MPVVLIYAAVALVGLIVSGVIAANILSHLDGTAASDSYSKSVLHRERAYLAMHKAGASDAEINRQLGPAPKPPKGMGFGVPVLLIGVGAATVAAAIFWKPISRALGIGKGGAA